MQSEKVDQIFAALAIAQGQIKNPTRNKTVSVTTRSGGTYKFSYADQAAVIDAIKKPLSENGLGYAQFVEMDGEGKFRLVTILGHQSGQWISTAYPLFIALEKDRDGNPLPPSSQGFGSAQTFMKRYALAAICGIAADDDDDANAADGNTAKVQDRKLAIGDRVTIAERVKSGDLEVVESGGEAPPVLATPIREPHEITLGDGSVDWPWFGHEMMERSKTAKWAEWREANMLNMERMKNEAPLPYAIMIAGIKKARA